MNFAGHLKEFNTHIRNNAAIIPNYGEKNRFWKNHFRSICGINHQRSPQQTHGEEAVDPMVSPRRSPSTTNTNRRTEWRATSSFSELVSWVFYQQFPKRKIREADSGALFFTTPTLFYAPFNDGEHKIVWGNSRLATNPFLFQQSFNVTQRSQAGSFS